MRDDLVGYLLGALEPPESNRIEGLLADPDAGPRIRRELDLLGRAIAPLAPDRDPIRAPAGLANRTLKTIADRSAAESPARHERHRRPERGVAPQARPGPATVTFPPDRRPRHLPDAGRSDGAAADGMSWIEKAILAATALAACILVLPALSQLVDDARRTGTERRLGRMGSALQGYASSHRRYPSPPDASPMSRGGLYAPTLVSEHRIVPDGDAVLVPGSSLSKSGTFRVPSLEELRAAVGTPAFDEMVKTMGGDFGYTLGHRDASGKLQPIRALNRGHHPLMADAPDESGERSDNHPDGLHHVLYEDGRVGKLIGADIHGDDHLFRNHDGHAAAGKDEEDAVIGDSHQQP